MQWCMCAYTFVCSRSETKLHRNTRRKLHCESCKHTPLANQCWLQKDKFESHNFQMDLEGGGLRCLVPWAHAPSIPCFVRQLFWLPDWIRQGERASATFSITFEENFWQERAQSCPDNWLATLPVMPLKGRSKTYCTTREAVSEAVEKRAPYHNFHTGLEQEAMHWQ